MDSLKELHPFLIPAYHPKNAADVDKAFTPVGILDKPYWI